MRTPPIKPKKPKFPSVERRCKYCKVKFKTKPTYNGSKMEFCTPGHRKAFHYEGETPLGHILSRQEKRMREIAQEEIRKHFEALAVRVVPDVGAARMSAEKHVTQ